MQIASDPACFLREDSPFLLHAPDFSNCNFWNAEQALYRHGRNWASFVLDDEIPNGFASFPNYPDGVLKSYRLTFMFKVRIYAWQLKDRIEQVRAFGTAVGS